MNAPPSNTTATRTKGGFSLASLALLVTVFAVLLSCADLQRSRAQIEWLVYNGDWKEFALMGAAALVGGCIGLIHVFVSGFTWRMFFLAPLIGAVAAEIGLMILYAPGSLPQIVLGIAVVMGITILLRVGAE